MNIQPDDIRAFTLRILTDEGSLLQELENLLQEETGVLSGDDVEAIQRVGAVRQRCVESLTRLDAERTDLCHMLSYGVGRHAFEKLLAWCDPSAALHQRWQANLDVARRCKELNDRNGALVSAKLGQVQKMLTTIRGAAPAPLYNARGSRYAALGNRDFGSA